MNFKYLYLLTVIYAEVDFTLKLIILTILMFGNLHNFVMYFVSTILVHSKFSKNILLLTNNLQKIEGIKKK